MTTSPNRVAIIGAGPAGLMAAEVIASAGVGVDVFDAMPSAGRKFLLAGRGGLNLTHAEPMDAFVSRYRERSADVQSMLKQFSPQQLRDWVHGLGITTFVGTLQRVFPSEMKAAPLLRAWISRLRSIDVKFHTHHRWQGWDSEDRLLFNSPSGPLTLAKRPTVFALGGASWARLGSDGAWVRAFSKKAIAIAPLQAANCGFDVLGGWSTHLRSKFAGHAFKQIKLRFDNADDGDSDGAQFDRQGEFVLTDTGIEGSLIYAVSAALREQINRQGSATFYLDTLPSKSAGDVTRQFESGRGSQSLSHFLNSKFGLKGVKLALLYELLDPAILRDDYRLALALKSLPVTVIKTRPIDEAISTAGGVCFDGLDAHLMLKAHSGIFCAGEMLDWEAPTGGYLLTAVMASGRLAGRGVLHWMNAVRPS